MWYTIVTVLHVIVCFFLATVVLLQQGKGSDAGAVFGGSSQTLFGSSGAGNLLTKLTSASAIIFMITSLVLTYGAAKQSTKSIFDNTPAGAPAPATTEVAPAAQPGATTETPSPEPSATTPSATPQSGTSAGTSAASQQAATAPSATTPAVAPAAPSITPPTPTPAPAGSTAPTAPTTK
jgi:preprotein translocase subunit SecG